MLVCTLGEPCSVNVELLAKALNLHQLAIGTADVPIVIVGSRKQWDYQTAKMALPAHSLKFMEIAHLEQAKGAGLFFLDLGGPWQDPRSLSPSTCGRLAWDALKTLQGFKPDKKMAVLTCPIDKLSCHKVGFSFPGQTEYFESLWEGQAVMTLAGKNLRVGLVTRHIPLKEVSRSLSIGLIVEKISKFYLTLKTSFGFLHPKIAVCGLNPHCGEGGLFGYEDRELISAAINFAKEKLSPKLFGPLPADTVFWKALQGDFDGVLAMYHDQGLGPIKTVYFDRTINLSGGLKHLRVSPDHGPAKDLIFSQKASTGSFEIAWQTCMDYLKGNRLDSG